MQCGISEGKLTIAVSPTADVPEWLSQITLANLLVRLPVFLLAFDAVYGEHS